MAVLCADHDELKTEWRTYLAQTQRHVEILRGVFEALGLDPEATTPGRSIVRDKGQALVSAMRKALKDAPHLAAVVAAECVVDAETKDHANWELIGELAKKLDDSLGAALADAHAQVEDEEDEHLYHTRGWCRELSLASLGLPAVFPPPEEQQDVRTAVDAAHAERARKTPSKVGSAQRGKRTSTASRD
jgi:hypothetical protein